MSAAVIVSNAGRSSAGSPAACGAAVGCGGAVAVGCVVSVLEQAKVKTYNVASEPFLISRGMAGMKIILSTAVILLALSACRHTSAAAGESQIDDSARSVDA